MCNIVNCIDSNNLFSLDDNILDDNSYIDDNDNFFINIENEILNDINLKKVTLDGYNLKYIVNQNYNICLEAVKNYGFALEFINFNSNYWKSLNIIELNIQYKNIIECAILNNPESIFFIDFNIINYNDNEFYFNLC